MMMLKDSVSLTLAAVMAAVLTQTQGASAAATSLRVGLVPAAASGTPINAMQWNPHYQCVQTDRVCDAGAVAYLSAQLTPGTLDFAGLPMWESLSLPHNKIHLKFPNYKAFAHVCPMYKETQVMVYNSKKWELVAGSKQGLCLDHNITRSAVVATFTSVQDATLTVTVAAAHFSHQITPSLAALSPALSGKSNVLIIADTNLDRSGGPNYMDNAGIFKTLKLNPLLVESFPNAPTCCAPTKSNPTAAFGLLPYDRIIANFGTIVESEWGFGKKNVNDFADQAWAGPTAQSMHLPVFLQMTA